jgi:toxin ParE1/3/4
VKRKTNFTPQAIEDLDEQYLFFVKESPDLALRYFHATEKTFQLLAQNPEIGEKVSLPQGALSGMRVWPVRDFRNYLIFYRSAEGEILILRVIHGARDLPTVLGENP